MKSSERSLIHSLIPFDYFSPVSDSDSFFYLSKKSTSKGLSQFPWYQQIRFSTWINYWDPRRTIRISFKLILLIKWIIHSPTHGILQRKRVDDRLCLDQASLETDGSHDGLSRLWIAESWSKVYCIYLNNKWMSEHWLVGSGLLKKFHLRGLRCSDDEARAWRA